MSTAQLRYLRGSLVNHNLEDFSMFFAKVTSSTQDFLWKRVADLSISQKIEFQWGGHFLWS